MINYECNKMSSILCVIETCARDPTPQGKHLVGDYRHYRPLWGESKYDFLIKRPSNLENKIGRRSWSCLISNISSGCSRILLRRKRYPHFLTKEGLLIKCLKVFKIYQIQVCIGSFNVIYRLFLPYAQF